MSLQGFWDVDIDDPNEDPKKVEAAAFLQKLDYEGGLDGFLDWGGWEAFPMGLRADAAALETLRRNMKRAIEMWAAKRGVQT